MEAPARPVLLAYDGSSDAKHAIATAGELLGGQAVVVHVYALPSTAPTGVPGAGIAFAVDPAVDSEVERATREHAEAVVSEGVDVARAAGFDPQPELVPGDGVYGVWNAIVSVGEQHDASVIVLGHGDLSWLEEKLLGRVDSGVVKHAGRPVLVVPAPAE
jgi:nucleotide-binding universal stress UspA family protein